jgi:hypothetical protein
VPGKGSPIETVPARRPWEFFVSCDPKGGFFVPSEHDVRQRAVICQDCWFWKEMTCALASPTDGVCANKRPVRGRRAQPVGGVTQAQLTPLAQGHARIGDVFEPVQAPTTPFAADAPESTFSLAAVRTSSEQSTTADDRVVDLTARQTRAVPPSFRDIRAGRAVAAARVPVAEVRIPVDELQGGTLVEDARRFGSVESSATANIDQLVERVRQRTAARLSRAGALGPA